MKNKIQVPLAMWIVFEAIGTVLWLTLDNKFYLINFSYIGTAIALGLFLYTKKIRYARNMVQIAVGLYMLVYLGILCNENMQIEGFWYYLFLGVFEAAVIHYGVAKIFGPFLFGRGWCGYACWTAMVLDLLPFRIPQKPRKQLGFLRYLVFAASFLYVGALFLLQLPDLDKVMLWSFIIGNVVYYILGVSMAYVFKDNRAFCKYLCPVTVFLKPASYFSLLRVNNDVKKCINCGKCRKVCPMDVDVVDNSRKRTNGTECILCFECVEGCPVNSLYVGKKTQG